MSAQLNTRIRFKSDTTENWRLASINNSFTGLKGEIIIFTDYKTKTDDEGNTINIPGIKISDGKSYIIDQPFVSDDIRDDLLSHINNTAIHVSITDRANWDGKVSVEINDDKLVFIV